MAKVKRIQGLKNIHVAKITGDGYATPVPVLGAKDVKDSGYYGKNMDFIYINYKGE